ncbi:MAG: patatin-like phospholipase family protein, partial [Bacteroidetes bacterium]
QQGARNLRFTTALRMNATYPYILPNVTLPTQPPVEVLDAGFRDNFGLKSATRFVHVFRDWIQENTSGVVIVIVRAFGRSRNFGSDEKKGVLDGIFNPLEIAFKVMSLQDYEHDNNLGFLYDLVGIENLEIVRFTYHPSEQLKDSPISFYITERERQDILHAIHQPSAQASFQRLQDLLKTK